MTKFIPVLTLTLAASCLSGLASAQSVTLDPGLYDYSHIIMIGGRGMPADKYEYCVRDGQNSKTLDELVASLAADGECTVSNVNMTSSTGRADISCTGTDLGDVSGTMEAEYGADFYTVDTRADLGPLPVHVKTKVSRRGECPADWNNPDGVSEW